MHYTECSANGFQFNSSQFFLISDNEKAKKKIRRYSNVFSGDGRIAGIPLQLYIVLHCSSSYKLSCLTYSISHI